MWFHLYDVPLNAEDESPGAYLLHDQVQQCIDVAEDPERESKSNQLKGWQVSDPFRGDHVLDAWYFAVWLICSQQIRVPKIVAKRSSSDPWAMQKEQFENDLSDREDRELGRSGRRPKTAEEAWKRLVSGDRKHFPSSFQGHYGNEA
jgi:hypothetical protein